MKLTEERKEEVLALCKKLISIRRGKGRCRCTEGFHEGEEI